MALAFGTPAARVATPSGATLSEPFEIEVDLVASKPTELRSAQVIMIARWGHSERQWKTVATPVDLTLPNTASATSLLLPQGASTLRAVVLASPFSLPTFPGRDRPAWSTLFALIRVKRAGLLGGTIDAQIPVELGVAAPSQAKPISVSFPGRENLPTVRLQHDSFPAGAECRIEFTLSSPTSFDLTLTAALLTTFKFRHGQSRNIGISDRFVAGGPRPIGTQTIRTGERLATISGLIPTDTVPTCSNRELACHSKLVVDLYSPGFAAPRHLELPIYIVGTPRVQPIIDGYTPADHGWFTNRTRA